MKENALNSLAMFTRAGVAAVLITGLLGGCSSVQQLPEQDTVADLQVALADNRVTDDRGRFREVFCQVMEAHGRDLPDYRPCEESIRGVGDEAGATGAEVGLGMSEAKPLVLLVPGLGWNCFAEFLDMSYFGPEYLGRFGYDVRLVPVDGLSGTANNAAMIHDYVLALPPEDVGRPIILGGYSKGAPDLLEALVTYPDLAEKVVAVIAMAGAVKGSPLAIGATQKQANLLTMVPGAECETEQGDNNAVRSLLPDVRQQWLDEVSLPAHIQYYSVVAFPEPARISNALQGGYKDLAEFDPRNDTQLVIFDQLIPGSKLLALVNADHWAVAVPVARSHTVIGGTLVDQNDFPREAFLEAVLRYIEEDR